MTHFIAIILSVIFVSDVFASPEFQFQHLNIIGDWHLKGESVLRIKLQTKRSVKVYLCNENAYLKDNKKCEFNTVRVYQYHPKLKGFYLASDATFCAELLQVSLDTEKELIRTVSPQRGKDDCGSQTGKTDEAYKL